MNLCDYMEYNGILKKVRFIWISHFNYNRFYYTVMKPGCVVYKICNKETAFINHWKFVVNFHFFILFLDFYQNMIQVFKNTR